MSVEFLVKLRDAGTMIADAANEELEKRNPTKKKWIWSIEKIVWVEATGAKGIYFRANPDLKNPDFKALLEDSKAHGGKLQRDGEFLWLFSDMCTIGRKRRG